MNHYDETICKFLSKLNIDSIKEITFSGKIIKPMKCVCGQSIKKGYIFLNKRNGKQCVVGYNCLQYIADYLGWNN